MSATRKDFIAALRRNQAIPALVAAELGVTRSAVQKRIKSNALFRDIVRDIEESILDRGEAGLLKALSRDEPWAITFYLRTKGKGRGYSQRAEITGADDGPVDLNILLKEISHDDVQALQSFVAARGDGD